MMPGDLCAFVSKGFCKYKVWYRTWGLRVAGYVGLQLEGLGCITGCRGLRQWGFKACWIQSFAV